MALDDVDIGSPLTRPERSQPKKGRRRTGSLISSKAMMAVVAVDAVSPIDEAPQSPSSRTSCDSGLGLPRLKLPRRTTSSIRVPQNDQHAESRGSDRHSGLDCGDTYYLTVKFEQLHSRTGDVIVFTSKGECIDVISVRQPKVSWLPCLGRQRDSVEVELPVGELATHHEATDLRGGGPFSTGGRRGFPLMLVLAWSINILIVFYSLVFLLCVGSSVRHESAFNSAAARAYALALGISFFAKDPLLAALVAILPVRSDKSTTVVGVCVNGFTKMTAWAVALLAS